MNWKRGITREVLLVWRWAVKFPSVRSWELFLRGLLANGQEARWWRETGDARLCPVLWSLPLGLLVVMPRCGEVSEVDYATFEGLPKEAKLENYGLHEDRTVLVDYGS